MHKLDSINKLFQIIAQYTILYIKLLNTAVCKYKLLKTFGVFGLSNANR